jgi:hypothetical protein
LRWPVDPYRQPPLYWIDANSTEAAHMGDIETTQANQQPGTAAHLGHASPISCAASASGGLPFLVGPTQFCTKRATGVAVRQPVVACHWRVEEVGPILFCPKLQPRLSCGGMEGFNTIQYNTIY